MKNGIFLLLGSNLDQPVTQLDTARKEIGATAGTICQASSLYKTAPWGITNQPDFYNQVIGLHTSLRPDRLLAAVQAIEKKMGRERKIKWGARIIDIDILFYHDEVVQTNDLTIPHPAIAERRFTLAPLAEIAPAFVHPVLKKDMATLLAECDDPCTVEKTGL